VPGGVNENSLNGAGHPSPALLARKVAMQGLLQ
jgi:hypothetical protein